MRPCVQLAFRLSSVLNTRSVFSACIAFREREWRTSTKGKQRYCSSAIQDEPHPVFWGCGEQKYPGRLLTCLISTMVGMVSCICPFGPCAPKMSSIIHGWHLFDRHFQSTNTLFNNDATNARCNMYEYKLYLPKNSDS